jgi:hypothetical protein
VAVAQDQAKDQAIEKVEEKAAGKPATTPTKPSTPPVANAFGDTNAITELTPEKARKLAAEFPGVKVEIEIAGRKGWELSLDGLTTLSGETAKALAKSKCNGLCLNGLTTISPEAAKSLAEFTMLKGGPTAGGGQGTWDVMFIRSKINPETKRPDPAAAEQVMVQLDYDGNFKIFVRADKIDNNTETWEIKASGNVRTLAPVVQPAAPATTPGKAATK